jgi:oxalate decarboxylase/phosphoglucose isomerase-like protein (cupin superfamily)
MTTGDEKTDLRGSEKKEAFHEAAEENVHTFKFETPDVGLEAGRKAHIKLAGTDNTRATIQVLTPGNANNLHYHPNMDLIWMVLKGHVRFYGPGGKITGEFHANEGILQPENSRYWFENIGDEDAWLLQIAGFPKGAKAARRIDVDPPHAKQVASAHFTAESGEGLAPSQAEVAGAEGR